MSNDISTWEPCPCGKPWTMVVKYAPEMRAEIDETIATCGPFVTVRIRDRTWSVSRRCIAYHGVTGPQLLSGASGFIEILG